MNNGGLARLFILVARLGYWTCRVCRKLAKVPRPKHETGFPMSPMGWGISAGRSATPLQAPSLTLRKLDIFCNEQSYFNFTGFR